MPRLGAELADVIAELTAGWKSRQYGHPRPVYQSVAFLFGWDARDQAEKPTPELDQQCAEADKGRQDGSQP